MKSKAENIAVLILAAGASTRMGSIKQLLPWAKTNLLGHAIEQAKNITEHVYVVLGANASIIKTNLDKEVIAILNSDWQHGMGASIAKGILEINNRKLFENVLIMLSDQPLLDSNYLAKLVKCHQNTTQNICATNYNGKSGVPAIFNKLYFPQLAELNAEYGAKELLRNSVDDTFVIDSNGKAIDIDTPEAYQLLLNQNV